MKNHLLRLTRSLAHNSSRRIAACLVVAGGMSLAAPAANAAPVTYAFRGVIETGDASTGLPGTPFSGTFAYDPSTLWRTDTTSNSNNYMFGPQSNSPDFSSLTLTVDGKRVFTGTGTLGIEVSGGGGASGAPASSVQVVSDDPRLDASVLRLVFNNPTVSLDPSHSLPVPLSLHDYPQASFALTSSMMPQSAPSLTGTITSLTQVPEPSVLALPALIAVGLSLGRLRHRSSRNRR